MLSSFGKLLSSRRTRLSKDVRSGLPLRVKHASLCACVMDSKIVLRAFVYICALLHACYCACRIIMCPCIGVLECLCVRTRECMYMNSKGVWVGEKHLSVNAYLPKCTSECVTYTCVNAHITYIHSLMLTCARLISA